MSAKNQKKSAAKTTPKHDNHFLRNFKNTLDAVTGTPATLHVCMESGHPQTLGRPANMLLQLLLKEAFQTEVGVSQNDIRVHLIPDRLSVPPLEGNILALGGPRSNVVSRIAMEYEVELPRVMPFYRRHTGATFSMDYVHIHRPDYDGRLLTEMTFLDDTAKELVSSYFPYLKEKANIEREVELFSVGRHFQRRNAGRIPSLSARIGQENMADYVLYDHIVETILPNIFSTEWNKRFMIVCHGLRDLGTLVGARRFNDPDHLENLRERLEKLKAAKTATRTFDAHQRGWSVIRPLEFFLEPTEPDSHALPDKALLPLLRKETSDLLKKQEYGKLQRYIGQFYFLKPHEDVQPKPGSENGHDPGTIPRASVMQFREDVIARHYPEKKSEKEAGARNGAGPKRMRETISHSIYNKDRREDVRSLKLDQIDEEQILDAMSVPRDRHFRRHDIYSLGCFEKKKTVYTQQTRALTLVHALFKAKKIQKNTKIAIIGGGVSGITAAIAAVELGARVVVCEQEKCKETENGEADHLFPIQRDCDQRWIHPSFYDWPEPHCKIASTDLPLAPLNWEANHAKAVMDRLAEQFEAFKEEVNREGDQKALTVYHDFKCRMILRDKSNSKHIILRRALIGRRREGDTAVALTQEWLDKQIAENGGKLDYDKTKFEWDELVLGSQPAFPDEPPPDPIPRSKLPRDLWDRWERDWKAEASRIVRRIQEGDIDAKPSKETQTSREKSATQNKGKTEQETCANAQRERLYESDLVDCDIVIFATGFGVEDHMREFNARNINFDVETPKKARGKPTTTSLLINKGGYWEADELKDFLKRATVAASQPPSATPKTTKSSRHADVPVFIVSGAGDGALIDILRLCINSFEEPHWHKKFMTRMNDLLWPERTGATWRSGRELLVFGYALKELLSSDSFRLVEGEVERLALIDRTMEGFDIDAFLDRFNIELNNLEVYNVSRGVQPFWAEASVAHILLVWCLHKKGRVRFVRGEISGVNAKTGTVDIRRRLTGKKRVVKPAGIVIRHGVGGQPGKFLDTQGLLIDMDRQPEHLADDARRLVALLRLSNRLHPETEKFFRHTVKQFK